jgi:hypothetical protein
MKAVINIRKWEYCEAMEMSKLEKVIKGLECCLNRNDCRNCPYADEYKVLDCITQSKTDALAMLKEQEESVPLKPLCKWLAGYAAPPGDTSWLPMFGSLEKAWEHELKELFTS